MVAEAVFEVRILPVSQLIPAPYNPRIKLRPGSAPYRKLAASLREFGLVEPLIWNEATGHIVGGHARLSLLKEIGVTEIPVSVVRLEPAREKALNIVLNNREAQGEFDVEKLGELLADLKDLPELELTGFDHAILKHLELQPEPVPAETTEATEEKLLLSIELNRPEYEQIKPVVDEWIQTLGVRTHLKIC